MSKSKPVPRRSSPSRPAARAARRRPPGGRGARVLGADKDEAVAGADRVAGERHALDQQRRVGLHQVPCRCRSPGSPSSPLATIELLGAGGRARELPFHAGREAGAAAAAHVGGLDLLDQPLGGHTLSARRNPSNVPRRKTAPAGRARSSRLRAHPTGRSAPARGTCRRAPFAGVDDVALAHRAGTGGRGQGRRSGPSETDPSSRALAKSDAKPLLDVGPHALDLVRWVAAVELTRIRARELADGASIDVELADGRGIASVEIRTNSPFLESVEVHSKGRRVARRRTGGALAGALARVTPGTESPLVASLASQLESFGGSGHGLASAADGVAVMAAVDAARTSASSAAVWQPIPTVDECSRSFNSTR